MTPKLERRHQQQHPWSGIGVIQRGCSHIRSYVHSTAYTTGHGKYRAGSSNTEWGSQTLQLRRKGSQRKRKVRYLNPDRD
ncbi:MAG: hypothetical protein QXH07_03895 [Thermoplasmata archaeon]